MGAGTTRALPSFHTHPLVREVEIGFMIHTLNMFNIDINIPAANDPFLFGRLPIFRSYLSFREGKSCWWIWIWRLKPIWRCILYVRKQQWTPKRTGPQKSGCTYHIFHNFWKTLVSECNKKQLVQVFESRRATKSFQPKWQFVYPSLETSSEKTEKKPFFRAPKRKGSSYSNTPIIRS